MSTVTRTDVENQVMSDLRAVTSELHRVSLPVWLELGLPMAQLKALIAVASSAGVSVTGLARDLAVGEPAASQLVEQLVRRGYAQRQPDASDRRRVVVTVTEAGAELVAELRQGRHRHVEQWLASMTDSDVDALGKGLHALATAALRDEAGVE